jgi:hypothetical protein
LRKIAPGTDLDIFSGKTIDVAGEHRMNCSFGLSALCDIRMSTRVRSFAPAARISSTGESLRFSKLMSSRRSRTLSWSLEAGCVSAKEIPGRAGHFRDSFAMFLWSEPAIGADVCRLTGEGRNGGSDALDSGDCLTPAFRNPPDKSSTFSEASRPS